MDGLAYLGADDLGEEEPEPVQAYKTRTQRVLNRALYLREEEPEPVQAIRQRGFTRRGFGGHLVGGEVVIPTVGADYTDAKTVAAVQAALVKNGYSVGDSGPNHDGVDGIFGAKTKTAIKKLQADLHQPEVNGKINEGVIMALKVTPGVLPPGVTVQGRAAVQAQVALDAATAAMHASESMDDSPTPASTSAAAQAVAAAAQQAMDAAPAEPPALKEAVQKAQAKAKAAKTPEQVKAAAAELQAAAGNVRSAVAPSWWTLPTWEGGPERWKTGAVAGGTVAVAGGILWALLG